MKLHCVSPAKLKSEDLKDIPLTQPAITASAEHVAVGIPVPKTLRVAGFSSGDWEAFVQEWATSLKESYCRVARFGGAGDLGLDIIGFAATTTFAGGWDNYQCKHYDHPLRPSDVWIEIGKLIYYSYDGEYPVPRKSYFVGSRGIGTTLEKLLADPRKLREQCRINWKEHCESKITTTIDLTLAGELLTYFEQFDFSIFSGKSVVELLEQHAKTPFHTIRFGGGLPARPAVAPPPAEHQIVESRYIRQLFEAYGDHLSVPIGSANDLAGQPALTRDFLRQRERFYHAEALRNFARDTVPEGTFNRLQDEVFQGVVDTCDSPYADGFTRMRETVAEAARLSTTSNPLASVIQVQDRQGICHQLANDDRLIWVLKEGG